MGRGLSPLQRTFLTIGARNRQSGNDPYWTPDVYTLEVVAEHWQLALPFWLFHDDGRRNHDRFLRRGAGVAVSPAQHGAVSRAASRLIERGLLVKDRGGKGFSLTAEGLVAAAELTSRTKGLAPLAQGSR
jgi:hypothetical protein